MAMNNDLLAMVTYIERERGVDREIVLMAIEQAIQQAARHNPGVTNDLRVTIDRKTLQLHVYDTLVVTDEDSGTGFISVARARRIVNLENGPDFFDLPLIAVAIGDSVAFGGFPGEPFNDIGKAIKKDSPFKLTILSCLTNGSRGYFPFSDAYVGGGYESATSPFGPTVADQLIEGQLGLLKSIKAK